MSSTFVQSSIACAPPPNKRQETTVSVQERSFLYVSLQCPPEPHTQYAVAPYSVRRSPILSQP
eukprot:3112180-Rhodomonas_salina.1